MLKSSQMPFHPKAKLQFHKHSSPEGWGMWWGEEKELQIKEQNIQIN